MNSLRKGMVRGWKSMSISKCACVLRLAANRIFLQKYSLKLQMISKQTESSYHLNRLTCLTSIIIHRGRFPQNGQGARMRTGSRTRQRRPRRSVASGSKKNKKNKILKSELGVPGDISFLFPSFIFFRGKQNKQRERICKKLYTLRFPCSSPRAGKKQ